MNYPDDRVSKEPLDIIFGNECDLNLTGLTAKRFRRVEQEIAALRAKVAAYEVNANVAGDPCPSESNGTKEKPHGY